MILEKLMFLILTVARTEIRTYAHEQVLQPVLSEIRGSSGGFIDDVAAPAIHQLQQDNKTECDIRERLKTL